jgi:hypothetical protein
MLLLRIRGHRLVVLVCTVMLASSTQIMLAIPLIPVPHIRGPSLLILLSPLMEPDCRAGFAVCLWRAIACTVVVIGGLVLTTGRAFPHNTSIDSCRPFPRIMVVSMLRVRQALKVLNGIVKAVPILVMNYMAWRNCAMRFLPYPPVVALAPGLCPFEPADELIPVLDAAPCHGNTSHVSSAPIIAQVDWYFY